MTILTSGIQTLFTLLSLISDNLIPFDLWLLSLSTPLLPAWQNPTPTRRWLATTTTCLIYALFEPLLYHLMTSVSSIAMWWFLMACWLNLIIGIQGMFVLVGEGIKEVKDEHDEKCNNDEKDGTTVDFRDCEKGHTMPTSFHFAPLLVIFTAAATNSGLHFYTRYLSSEDSETWRNGFSFGWVVIAGLCLLFFGFTKWEGRQISRMVAGVRRKQLERKGEEESKVVETVRQVSNLAWLFIVRAGLRWMLGQDVFTVVRRSGDGARFELEGSLHIVNVAKPEEDEAREHAFDRWMFKIPVWVGPVCSVISLTYSVWAIWTARRESRKQKEKEKEGRQGCA